MNLLEQTVEAVYHSHLSIAGQLDTIYHARSLIQQNVSFDPQALVQQAEQRERENYLRRNPLLGVSDV